MIKMGLFVGFFGLGKEIFKKNLLYKLLVVLFIGNWVFLWLVSIFNMVRLDDVLL